MYEGSEFKVATRYPTSLNTLFVSMVYCTGLPILLPIASISFFVSYWIDKISLLRLYSLPPRFDDALARLASKVMPWAALMHTFFAVWMLGQNDILKSEAFNGSFGDENAEEQYEDWKARIEEWDRLGVVPRIARLNVLPMFLLGFALFLWLTMGVLLKVCNHPRCCVPFLYGHALTVACALVGSLYSASLQRSPAAAVSELAFTRSKRCSTRWATRRSPGCTTS